MDFSLKTRSEGDVVIIETSGYLNNVGGEKISEECYKEIENGPNIVRKRFYFSNKRIVHQADVAIIRLGSPVVVHCV